MRTCPCGFEAPANVPPTSVLWHREHRTAHLKRYPNVDEETRASLDMLVFKAEHLALADFVRETVPLDPVAIYSVTHPLVDQLEAALQANPVHVMAALTTALGGVAAGTSIADKLLEIAIESLQRTRASLQATAAKIQNGEAPAQAPERTFS